MSSSQFQIKKRCFKCQKKTLVINNCKCDNNYCLNCLPYYNHNCNYNWKKDKKDILQNSNPVISFSKIQTI